MCILDGEHQFFGVNDNEFADILQSLGIGADIFALFTITIGNNIDV